MEGISRFLRSRYFWLGFAALTVFVYLFGLTIPLLGPDEPRYAQVAREMYYREDWVTTTLGGHNWFEKPALLYWLQIASYNLFGVNEFAARFGSALFGLGTITSLWLLGRRVSAVDSDGLNSFGNYLGLIAATTLGIIVFARGASFDIILTFPITAACVAFFLYDHASRKANGAKGMAALAGFYFFVGVSLLAKGLVGIVFPFAIITFYLLLSRRLPSRAFLLSLLWGLPLTALVAATWYLPKYLTNGWEFIDEFFIQHHFQRYTSNKYLHPQPFHFFFWVLPLMTIPWLPFFFAAIWRRVRTLFSRSVDDDTAGINDEASLLRFAWAWLLVPLVFFSFSGSKLPGYIMPAVPPAMIITAAFVYRWRNSSGSKDVMVKGLAVATFAVIISLLVFVVPQFAERDSVRTLIAKADAAGYSQLRVAGLHGVSHNAEFYASGRLIRSDDGKQRRLSGPLEAREAVINSGGKLLVLVPVEWEHELDQIPDVSAERIASNGDLTIAVLKQ